MSFAIGIPDDVAGATLMAAGCSAPALFASGVGAFLQESQVGVSIVVGGAPFSLMVICGAVSLAVLNGTLDAALQYEPVALGGARPTARGAALPGAARRGPARLDKNGPAWLGSADERARQRSWLT